MYGIVIAFKDFNIARGILGSEWVGIKWFDEFFNGFYFFRLLKNTVLLSVYSIIFSSPVPIVFALGLDELRRPFFKKAAQTISYAPNFISIVVVVGMMYSFFSTNGGIVNEIIAKLGFEKVDFMSTKQWFRPLYVASGIWQTFGVGSIIYLAALTSINPQLYEALDIDGGNRFHKIWYIKLQTIKPMFIIMLLLALGSILSVGYEKVLLMYSERNYEVSDVIQTYVYRAGIQQARESYAAAVGFFNSITNLIIIIVFNFIAKKTQDIYLW